MKFRIRSLCAAMTLAAASSAVYAEDLLQIYQQALTNDPVVLQAQAQRNSLYEKIEESRAPLLPSLSASVGYGKSWVDQNVDGIGVLDSDGFNGNVTLNQVIYNHSAWVGLDIAELAASQADASYASSLQGLIIRVTTAYFNVLSAQDALEFQKAQVAAIGRQLEQTKQRFAVGLTAITDVHEAQAQYDLSRAQEIQAENTVQNNYQALQEITGLPYDKLAILDTKRFSAGMPMPTSAGEWLKMAEDSSLDLLAQRIAKDIANQQISLAKAGHMPSIKLNAGYKGTFEQSNAEAERGTTDVALQLSVPIFEGFKVSSQVNQAQYDFVAASEKLEQTHRAVSKDIRSNFNNVVAAISSIKAYEQTVISSESALKATQAGFEVGTRTIVDVLNSTQNLYNSKRQLSDARYAYIQSVLALKQAAGTLTEEDVVMINKGLTNVDAPVTK
ncbi:MAG: outer membrane channel protein TolC [Shewanella sp.]|nr:outer membrane channel protein TolC [Shewanella sp.]MCF1429413.1 outer membrane channel protein TolC [Shewanella sp.]MCF1440080.1 outer membrane channel protein TolC [Shewanella sp.]MCF1456014.1 outer membrane channel protein TolC [Shewanella sp.]